MFIHVDVHMLDPTTYSDALNKYLLPVAEPEIEACRSEGGSLEFRFIAQEVVAYSVVFRRCINL
jgi:hypothetical protein